jgi:Mrp family chromosome partitioning ATPase
VLALLRGALEQFMGTPPKPSAGSERGEKPLPQVAEIPAIGRREQLSRLRAELLAAPADHSVLLVRASSDEALDLVALELARAVDESGQKVVVIDADLKAHIVSSRLRYNQCLGVRDILVGKASIREAALGLGRTDVKIVPVGTAALTLPNEQMRGALALALRQARQFGRVIIDGGQLGTAPPDFGLYAMADEVIFLEAVRGDRLSDVSVLVDLLRHRRITAKSVFIDPNSNALAA